MSTVQTETGASSAAPALLAPCPRFAWCARTSGHTEHVSAPVPLPGDEDRVLFAETDGTGELLYGPVLGGGDADEPVEEAWMLAARLRVAATRLEDLANAAEGGAA